MIDLPSRHVPQRNYEANGWQTECDCGWLSGRVADIEHADRMGESHVRMTAQWDAERAEGRLSD